MSTLSERVLARFSRRTTGRRFIPEIDGLRFIAIAMVVVGHIATRTIALYQQRYPGAAVFTESFLARTLASGWFGVRIFFLISGFVLALPFLARVVDDEPRVSLSRYYVRRVTRIEPPYLVALLLSFLLVVAVGGASLGELAPNLFAGSVYLHGPLFGTANAVNGAFWSLEVEIQFYVLMPLLALLFKVPGLLGRRAAVLAMMIVFLWLRTSVITQASPLR